MSLVSFVGGEGNLLATGPRARARHRAAPARAHQRGPGAPALGGPPALPGQDHLHLLQGRSRAACSAPSSASAARPRSTSRTATRSSSSPTARSTRTTPPSPRCWPSRPCTTTSSARACARACGLIVETGEAREVHHFACLLGLRRLGHQPLPRLRDHRGHAPRAAAAGGLTRRGGPRALPQGRRQGAAQDDVQDGHLDHLLATSGPRSSRPWASPTRSSRSYFPGTVSRIGGIDVATIERETLMRHAAAYPDRGRRRRDLELGRPLPVAPARRAPPPRPGHHPQAAAGRAHQRLRASTASTPGSSTSRPRRPSRCAHLLEFTDLRARADRRGRAGRAHREALRHRGHVLRLDLLGGAHDAGHRHEPPRRPLQHRRGRRGPGPLRAAAQRRQHALGHQAGGLGPLRRDLQLPRQRRRAADQDGPGRQARRGRPAARPQGGQAHRTDAPLDARRRPHLARRRTTTSTPSRTSRSSSTTSRTPTRGRASASSWWPRWAWARSPPASPRRTRTSSSSPATTAARAPRRSRRSSTPACPGSWASPRPTRCSCATTCATASCCRPTACCAPAATSPSPRSSAPRSGASPPAPSSPWAAS